MSFPGLLCLYFVTKFRLGLRDTDGLGLPIVVSLQVLLYPISIFIADYVLLFLACLGIELAFNIRSTLRSVVISTF